MRTFRHWTSRYLIARARNYLYEKANPDLPWLTPYVNDFLASYLRKTDVGVEFGSGRSTLWLSERVASLTSVEHNPQWYEKVKENLEKRRASNVTYLFRPRDSAEEEAEDSAYVRGIDKFPMESLDFALVDGIYRSDCAKKTLERIRPGGILIIDNIERYLPSKSMAPSARSDAQGHASVKWMQFQQCVQNWRIIWTSNGVWDTSIWIKPPQA